MSVMNSFKYDQELVLSETGVMKKERSDTSSGRLEVVPPAHSFLFVVAAEKLHSPTAGTAS